MTSLRILFILSALSVCAGIIANQWRLSCVGLVVMLAADRAATHERIDFVLAGLVRGINDAVERLAACGERRP